MCREDIWGEAFQAERTGKGRPPITKECLAQMQEVFLPTSAPTPEPFGFPDCGSRDHIDLRCLHYIYVIYKI